MSYRSLGFLDVDAEARELASYAGQLMEDEMKARMPGIIASLQPNLNAAATKAVKASLQDAAIKEAIAGTQEKVATYALIGGLGIVLATSALSWYLIKDLGSHVSSKVQKERIEGPDKGLDASGHT